MRAWFAAGGAVLLVIAGVTLWRTDRASAVALPPSPRLAAFANVPETSGPPSATPRAIAPDAPAPDARSTEDRRFARYDKDSDGAITRDEYLASRRKYFAKIDKDGDGKLSFDEYAVKTETRFEAADADRKGSLSPVEFAKTAVKRTSRACPPAEARDADA